MLRIMEKSVCGDLVEKMTKFSYLKDVFSSGGGVQEAATAKVRCGWKKFKDIASVLCKRSVCKSW